MTIEEIQFQVADLQHRVGVLEAGHPSAENQADIWMSECGGEMRIGSTWFRFRGFQQRHVARILVNSFRKSPARFLPPETFSDSLDFRLCKVFRNHPFRALLETRAGCWRLRGASPGESPRNLPATSPENATATD